MEMELFPFYLLPSASKKKKWWTAINSFWSAYAIYERCTNIILYFLFDIIQDQAGSHVCIIRLTIFLFFLHSGIFLFLFCTFTKSCVRNLLRLMAIINSRSNKFRIIDFRNVNGLFKVNDNANAWVGSFSELEFVVSSHCWCYSVCETIFTKFHLYFIASFICSSWKIYYITSKMPILYASTQNLYFGVTVAK